MLTLRRSAEVEMEVDHFSNGVSESSSNGFLNGSSTHGIDLEECDGDMGENINCAQSSVKFLCVCNEICCGSKGFSCVICLSCLMLCM